MPVLVKKPCAKLGSGRRKKKEDPREMAFTPDPLLLLLRSLFLMYPIDWSPILTEIIAFQLRWRSISIIV